MNKMPMSRAATGLLRSLLARTQVDSNRILLSDIRSTDWRSLTLDGERHAIVLRIAGPDSEACVRTLTDGIEDAEFRIPGQIVADIAATATALAPDGSTSVTIEALTIAE